MCVNPGVRLRRYPAPGPLTSDDFEIVDEPQPALEVGQIRVESIYASVDAGQRAMVDRDSSYVVKMKLGDAVRCAGVVGRVIESRDQEFAAGDYALIFSSGVWQKYIVPVRDRSPILKVDPTRQPLHVYIGLLGMVGFTAYVGIFEIGKPKFGETVVVSAAAGAVGGLAGQFAKIGGARVIGIAGGNEKCDFVTHELGFDACIDYKAEDFAAQLSAACADGIDVYFDNVGGDILDAVWPRLNVFGRVVICGQISQYTGAAPRGPNLFATTLKRLTVRGFLANDHYEVLPEFQKHVGLWFHEGRLKHFASIEIGLENAYRAINNLVSGGNRGKQMIQVTPER